MTTHRTYNPGPAMPLASEPASITAPKIARATRETVRSELAEASARRAAANTPWPDKPEAPSELVDTGERSIEKGRRVMLRCALPNIESVVHRAVRTTLRERLCEIAGGYTSYAMHGGWRAPDGKIMHENGTIFEVSFDPNASSSWCVYLDLRHAFVSAGKAIGEHWIHIERHNFEAHHTNARLF